MGKNKYASDSSSESEDDRRGQFKDTSKVKLGVKRTAND